MSGEQHASGRISSVEILVVNDDDQVRDALSLLLERQGHRLRIASDATEARIAIGESVPDLVLADVSMPGESGLELLASLRAEHPGLPVVMVSGSGESKTAITALELGAYGWVTKPFDSSQVAIAIANARIRARLEQQHGAYQHRLERAVKARTSELQRTVVRLERSETRLRHVAQDTITALSRAIERRDIETAAHVERVSRYATMLAEHYGLPPDRCAMIRAATPMHDVGKVGLPDGILLKPGKVTAAEHDVIKQHVALGHEILSMSPQPLLRLAAEIALTHHERWDGAGYLAGLRGQEIPLEGRITAIADTFDALVSRRVYKAAVPVQDAFEILRQNSGTQFDPELVDLFLEHRDEAVAILALHPED